MTTVRVRGIYTTALTRLLAETDGYEIVQPSESIDTRFESSFADTPATVTIETTDDRLGVCVNGVGESGQAVTNAVTDSGIDALSWSDPVPTEAVFDGRVTDTVENGAIVDLGEGEGYLPFPNTNGHVTPGDQLRVQVATAVPPWTDDRPVLRCDTAVANGFARLRYGSSTNSSTGIDVTELLSTDPREGWAVRWSDRASDASFDALTEALDDLNERAERIERVLGADLGAPQRRATTQTTTWVWFGRETRFALDDHRRSVTTTMDGHHRIKAGAAAASAAVDFTEAVCEPADSFPFDVTTRQFGPHVGDRIALRHGKPDGRCFDLGSGEVTDHTDETITIERRMSPGGTYDALGVERRAGDTAVTKLTEGRWWYPTVYRSAEGKRRGTYVNVCTPVELFPESARYVDLHVDVVKHADGTVERVDDDELDAACEQGNVPEPLAERARTVATSIERALSE
ncbi:DUF402 domain-containing protein [Halocatena pleomorpha]|uniref:Probable ribonuclease FAU-1 n=1 Tax=Halocatena pleomorpha TaxID=1785090 RepID=A0A3P3RIZ2_9EURY|nr:DUF402 domain-containing protein [Halocatena pleomorpha]RRJ33496.1 DUF402 domain-containing protein [Halocatena pleomorpha]